MSIWFPERLIVHPNVLGQFGGRQRNSHTAEVLHQPPNCGAALASVFKPLGRLLGKPYLCCPRSGVLGNAEPKCWRVKGGIGQGGVWLRRSHAATACCKSRGSSC